MVCRIKNRHTFKSLPILNSAYFTECRFVIRHITQTDTETETEANFTHIYESEIKSRFTIFPNLKFVEYVQFDWFYFGLTRYDSLIPDVLHLHNGAQSLK